MEDRTSSLEMTSLVKKKESCGIWYSEPNGEDGLVSEQVVSNPTDKACKLWE